MASVTISVTGVNDAPVLTGLGATAVATEQVAQAVLPGVNNSDTDGTKRWLRKSEQPG